MNGAHQHSRFSNRKIEAAPNEHKSPSTPCSPSSSSGHNSITVADRRKTKSSKYLVSEDFKSDFATKLSRFRQRETNGGSSQHLSCNPADHDEEPVGEDDEGHETDNNHTTTTHTTTTANTTATYTACSSTANIINTAHPVHPSRIPPTIPSAGLGVVADQESILIANRQEAKPEAYPATTPKQKPHPSFHPLCHKPCDEGPEEQSARYEVISKLADQLAEQIEQNDSLLYDLGVVRSNNARLQAMTADKEDEVACLSQRNRQLESIIVKFNSSQPVQQSQAHDLAQVPLTLLSQTHSHLCQLLSLTFSKRQSAGHSKHSQFKTATQVRQVRRYSWSGPHPSCPRDHSPTPHKSVDHNTNQQHPRDLSTHPSSSQGLLSEDVVARGTHLVDLTHHESLKDQIHRLEAHLAHGQLVCAAAEAALRSLIESIARQTQSPNLNTSHTKIHGLGLFPGNPPTGPLRPRNPNVSEPPSQGRWPVSVASISDEHHNTSSPLLALASFGFAGWGRKPDLASPPNLLTDGEAGISSLITISDDQSHAGAPMSRQTAEKESVQPFMRFGLRSLFNQSPASQLTKAASVSSSRPPPDPSRKPTNPSFFVGPHFTPQISPADQGRMTETQPENIPNENALPLAYGPMLDASKACALAGRNRLSDEDAKVSFHNPDGRLLLGEGVTPSHPNVIVI